MFLKIKISDGTELVKSKNRNFFIEGTNNLSINIKKVI